MLQFNLRFTALALSALMALQFAQFSAAQSCVGKCGLQSGGAGTCWCEEACLTYGDCCSNFLSVCKTPLITGVNPNTATTLGNILVTLTGLNFGAVNAAALVRFKPFGSPITIASSAATSWTATQIKFNLPAGTGAGCLFEVVNQWGVTNTVASPVFNFAAPTITSVVPLNIPTYGGLTVTLTGTNYGALGSGSVTIGGLACPITTQSQTQIKCTSPVGSGWNKVLILTIGGQQAAPKTMAYIAPVITTIAPAGALVVGTLITLSGSNFANTIAATEVTVGGRNCPLVSSTFGQVKCTFPNGEGLHQVVRIGVDGVANVPGVNFIDYRQPGLISVTPLTGSTQGGTIVTITGTNFGTTGSVGFGSLTCLDVGQTAPCTITYRSSTELRVSTPAGDGSNYLISVTTGGQTTAETFYKFTYAIPVISAVTGSFDTVGGSSISVDGSNFGLAPTVSLNGVSCTVVSFTAHTQIIFTLPAGSGTAKPLVVTANGQNSAAWSFSYSAPTVTSFIPILGSTAGGFAITISGTNFGTSSVVLIGTATCIAVSQSQTQIVCTAPAASAGSVAVSVNIAGQTVVAAQSFTYYPPDSCMILGEGASCNDNDACTQTDTCQSGTCVGSNPVTCTALDQCHIAGVCDSLTGQCSNPNAEDSTTCSDNDACTQVDTCQSGACVGSSPVTCTALDQCHVAGVCDSLTGQCSDPAATDSTPCSDRDACTQTDTCQSGTCVGSNPVVCTAFDQCHVAGVCDSSTGQCSNPNAADSTSCSDDNGCTQVDTCQSGVCQGSNPVTCSQSSNPCQLNACNQFTGQCTTINWPNGFSCNDGNACTQTDTCQAGTCVGSNPKVCTQAQCRGPSTCSPSTGSCSVGLPVLLPGVPCDDGNHCTQNDVCFPLLASCVGALIPGCT